MSVNSTSSQYPTGWMYGLLASHLRTNRMHLQPHAHGDTHMASILLTILPIIICIVPVVKVNEEPVVDSSSNGCYADEWRVLPVNGFQLHPSTESWRCDWLNRADNTRLKKKAWSPGTETIEISLILLKCVCAYEMTYCIKTLEEMFGGQLTPTVLDICVPVKISISATC